MLNGRRDVILLRRLDEGRVKLCDEWGEPIPEDELYVPHYRERCRTCGMRISCNGCGLRHKTR